MLHALASLIARTLSSKKVKASRFEYISGSCGHAQPSVFELAEELQVRHRKSVEYGAGGVDISPFVFDTPGWEVLDFSGAVYAATTKVMVDYCEVCEGTVDPLAEGYRGIRLVNRNGEALTMTMTVHGPREGEEWTREQWDRSYEMSEEMYVTAGLARLARGP